MTQFQLGSISTGTLRPEDLLKAFTITLHSMESDAHYKKYDTQTLVPFRWSALLEDATNMVDEKTEWDDYMLDELLPDALQEYCPPFVYFGTLEGDGADFGFWPDMESLDYERNYWGEETAEWNEEHLVNHDLLVHISDHGNVTVMDMERNVLWSVV